MIQDLLHDDAASYPIIGMRLLQKTILILVCYCFQPQQPLLNYTVEAIGPFSCTKDGIYLVGGGLSGNAYLWDVCEQIINYLLHLTFFADVDAEFGFGSQPELMPTRPSPEHYLYIKMKIFPQLAIFSSTIYAGFP